MFYALFIAIVVSITTPAAAQNPTAGNENLPVITADLETYWLEVDDVPGEMTGCFQQITESLPADNMTDDFAKAAPAAEKFVEAISFEMMAAQIELHTGQEVDVANLQSQVQEFIRSALKEVEEVSIRYTAVGLPNIIEGEVVLIEQVRHFDFSARFHTESCKLVDVVFGTPYGPEPLSHLALGWEEE